MLCLFIQTVVGQRFAGNGPNGRTTTVSVHPCHQHACIIHDSVPRAFLSTAVEATCVSQPPSHFLHHDLPQIHATLGAHPRISHPFSSFHSLSHSRPVQRVDHLTKIP